MIKPVVDVQLSEKGSISGYYEGVISNSAKYEWFVMAAKGKVKTQYSC